MKKKAVIISVSIVAALLFACAAVWVGFLLAFPRPYRETVEGSGAEPSLVYAVIRAESGGREDAVSRAGAVGLMQILPSTAEFICGREGIPFDVERLKEGEYNILLGTKYLLYLMARFDDETAVLAAYNAGEGTVMRWLGEAETSADGKTLLKIPYPETAAYVKKIAKFRKIYEILYP